MKRLPPGAEWLLTLALLAYPRRFRRRFGAEMRADFRRLVDTPGGQSWQAFRRALGNHLASGLSERGAALARWPLQPHRRPHLYEPDGRRAMFWDTLRSDVGQALAVARTRPLVMGLAVLALALGIGANSAIFTVVNGVLLRSLPCREDSELVMVWSSNAREQKPVNVVSPANFLDYREGAKDLADIEAFASFVVSDQLQTDDGPEMVLVVNTGLQMFDILGRQPILGRTFQSADVPEVVLSHGYWQRRFGGDPTIIGRALNISGRMQTVVGVMPDDFVFPYATMLGPDGFTTRTGVDMWSLWVPEKDPFAYRSGQIVRNVHYVALVGRRHAGVTNEALQARLAGVARQLEQAYPASNSG